MLGEGGRRRLIRCSLRTVLELERTSVLKVQFVRLSDFSTMNCIILFSRVKMNACGHSTVILYNGFDMEEVSLWDQFE